MNKKVCKSRKIFIPRAGNFNDEDLIDYIRVFNPQDARFSAIDLNFAYKINQLSKEEILLYFFYCLMAGFDKSRQSLSDYGLQEIASALKMSKVNIIKARGALAELGLIGIRKQMNQHTRSKERTIVQVLAFEPGDTIIIRRNRKDCVSAGGGGGSDLNHPGLDLNQGGLGRDGFINKWFRTKPALRREVSADINVQEGEDVKSVNVFNNQEFLVEELVEELGDEQSAGFYRKIVRLMPEGIIMELLSETKYTDRMGRIRTTKAQFFTDLAIRYMDQNEIQWRRQNTCRK
ncbi:MAG: hypothetical protein HY747_04865 [Elusimicrobia bacterium]|nr:hypothetical protein [Elusimicrobiota bacterium]